MSGQVRGGRPAYRFGGNDSGRPGHHYRTAVGTSARSEVDDVVRTRNDRHIVFGHHYRVAGVNEAMQLSLEQLDVGGGVKPSGGLIQHVESVPALDALQLRGQLDALGLAAGEFGCRLTQPQIPQPDITQSRQTSCCTA